MNDQNSPSSIDQSFVTDSEMGSHTTNKHHTRAIFVFGSIGLLVLIALLSAAYILFVLYPQSSTLVVTPKEVITPTQDPLVSVVPDVTDSIDGSGVNTAPAVLPTDPKQGTNTAKVTIIEFGDFQCGNCAQMQTIIDAILAKNQDTVRYVWKDMPLVSEHEYAKKAAIAARCAGDQNAFWSYHALLLKNQDQFLLSPWNQFAQTVGIDANVFDSCLAANKTEQMVIQSYFIGEALGVDEVPTFYINNHKLVGPQTEAQIQAVIDSELR